MLTSVRYAPTPRFSFCGFVSALKASEMPRMASGGACGIERRYDAALREADDSHHRVCRCMQAVLQA